MPMAGVAVNDVLTFRCMRQTIHQLVTRYVHIGPVRERQRPGRPHATTSRTDRFITLTHLRQRFVPMTVTVRRYGLSTLMIGNRLRKKKKKIYSVRGVLIKAR